MGVDLREDKKAWMSRKDRQHHELNNDLISGDEISH